MATNEELNAIERARNVIRDRREECQTYRDDCGAAKMFCLIHYEGPTLGLGRILRIMIEEGVVEKDAILRALGG